MHGGGCRGLYFVLLLGLETFPYLTVQRYNLTIFSIENRVADIEQGFFKRGKDQEEK